MDNSIALQMAFKLDGEGNGEAFTIDELESIQDSETPYWAHFNINHKDTRPLLSGILDLEPMVISALLASHTRPRVTEYNDGCLVILRGVNLNKDETPEDMVAIGLYVDRHRAISVIKRYVYAVDDIANSLSSAEKSGPFNTSAIISTLAIKLCERMEPTLTNLNEETDKVEELLLENAKSELRKNIIHIRKQSILFRRYLAPQRDALMRLKNIDQEWMTEKKRRQVQEALDRTTRFVEDLDTVRERTQIVQDELTNALTDRLNKNMYILSVISSIFLPLGFLTGLLGINVGGIPGAEDIHAFWIFSAGLIILVIGMLTLFKRLKWF